MSTISTKVLNTDPLSLTNTHYFRYVHSIYCASGNDTLKGDTNFRTRLNQHVLTYTMSAYSSTYSIDTSICVHIYTDIYVPYYSVTTYKSQHCEILCLPQNVRTYVRTKLEKSM